MNRFIATFMAVASACCMLAPDNGGGGGVAELVKKWYILKKKVLGHAIGEKIELTEEDATDLLIGRAIELVEDPTTELASEVIGKVTKKIGEIVEQALEQAKKNLANAKGQKIFNLEVKDKANDDNGFGYETFGEYMHDVMLYSKKQAVITEKMGKLLKYDSHTKASTTDDPMLTQDGESGGALIPPTFSDKLYRKTFEESALLSKVDTYTIGGNSIVFPRLKEDSRATGSRYGGVQTSWVAEGSNLTGTRPKFDRLQLTLKKLMALVFVTQEQLDDTGMALEQLLMNVISSELNFNICDALFNGDGVGKPLGIMASPSLYTLAKEGSQTAATVNANNISKMYSRVQASCRKRATWYINQEVEPQLDLLALSIGSGGSTVPMYLMPGGLTGEAPGRLKGRPVEVVEWCQGLGTVGDIILWDENSYCFVTKGGIKTAMSMHLRFDYDEMVFRFTYRCDGAPWWPSTLTPYKGTLALSTHVALATRA